MKYLLILIITPILLYSENLELANLEATNKLLERASKIDGIDIHEVAKIKTEKKEKVLNLDQVAKADAILLQTKINLLCQAKLDLHHELVIHRAQERIKREAKERELQLAEVWQNSRTGRIDGRSWFDLYEDERREYRKLYFDFLKK